MRPITKTSLFFLLILLGSSFSSKGQFSDQSFSDSRVILSHSYETLKQRELDFRISHWFGDLAGANGGVQSFFGMDNISDVRFALELGITDDLMLGLGRTKGGGAPHSNVLDGFLKYRMLRQTKDNSKPLTITGLGGFGLTMMESNGDPASLGNFEKFAHRGSYIAQLIIGRRLNEYVSLQVSPSYVHRNLVAFDDENGLFALGLAGRYRFLKHWSLLVDYYLPFSELRDNDPTYHHPFAFGLEIVTGGHTFQLNFANSRALTETQFLPYTRGDWSSGEFRFGFHISRPFKI